MCGLAFLYPAGAAAQSWETGAGAAAGATGGAVVSLGILTARAQLGHYMEAPKLLAWEWLPILSGAALGATMGARQPQRLADSVTAGAIGLAGGAGFGALVGHLWTGSGRGRWAGAVVGGAIGLSVASVWAASSDAHPFPTFSIAVSRLSSDRR
jgi:hypothetical protein